MGKRFFVAIDLPESTRQLLAAIDPHVRGVRWTDPAQMHLTLGFYSDVPAQALRKFLQSNAGFDAGMIRVEAFHLYSSRLTPAGPIHSREMSVCCRDEKL